VQPIVRPFEERDREAVWSLLKQFAVSHSPQREAFDRTFAKLVGRSAPTCLVAEVEDEVVGYLVGYRLPTLFANGPIFEIIELAVEEVHRGKGFGTALTDEATRFAIETGCIEIVASTRRAGSFYERQGFTGTGTYYKLKTALSD